MSRQATFIATGGTITCGDVGGKLEPILEADDLMTLARNAGFVGDLEFDFQSPYKIDSQLFNFDEHGRKLLKLLDSIPTHKDIVITTGTDTINWLSALVRNHERSLGFPRKVVILSSMHAPINEQFGIHVGNIMRGGIELLLEDDGIEKGVYVVSAQDEKAETMNFYCVHNTEGVAKCPGSHSTRIEGNEWHEASRISQVGSVEKPKKTRFRKVSTSSLPADSELDSKQHKQEKEERQFEGFISGCVMNRLPILQQTSPAIISGYLQDLTPGNVVVLEVGESWLDSENNLRREHLEMLNRISSQGVKIILNNRSFFRDGVFQDELQETCFERIAAVVAKNPNIFPMQYVPTDSAYARLALLGGSGGVEIPSCADMRFAQEPLGVRYVPSLSLVERGLAHLREKLPQNIVMEGLVDGVVARTVIEVLQRNPLAKNTIYSCGVYPAATSDAPYAASAEKVEMDSVRVERSMRSASEQMISLGKSPSMKSLQNLSSRTLVEQGLTADLVVSYSS